MMIEFHHPRTNQELEVIIIRSYIFMDRSGMVYTIRGKQVFDDINQTLMG